MFVKGKLIVDEESYNILRYESGRYQNVTRNGNPYTRVITNSYIIDIETTSESNLFRWAASKAMMKPVKIVMSHPSEFDSPRTIELYDTLCVGYDCYFDAYNNAPMITSLALSPAIVTENGELIMEQSWKVTDLSLQNNDSEAQQREEASYDELYMVDENNNRIDDVSPGMNVEVVVKTTGKTGKTISIDLSNEKVDFEYQGQVLVNDVLDGFTISKDIERIPLKVIKQQNQN